MLGFDFTFYDIFWRFVLKTPREKGIDDIGETIRDIQLQTFVFRKHSTSEKRGVG